MIAFVTALECSLRRLRELMSHKTDCDPRLLVVSVEVATLNDGWSLFVRRAGVPGFVLETHGTDLMRLVHDTTTQVERELSERRDHYIAAAELLNKALQVDTDV